MKSLSRFIAIVCALAIGQHNALASSAAPEPPIYMFGSYECHIDHAGGLTGQAKKFRLKNAPDSFQFDAYESPVTPEELQRPMRSTENYDPEPQRTYSASLTPPLFGAPTTALRSTDLATFTQGGVVITFSDDLSFYAYGPAPGDGADGVAAYSGSCRTAQ